MVAGISVTHTCLELSTGDKSHSAAGKGTDGAEIHTQIHTYFMTQGYQQDPSMPVLRRRMVRVSHTGLVKPSGKRTPARSPGEELHGGTRDQQRSATMGGAR